MLKTVVPLLKNKRQTLEHFGRAGIFNRDVISKSAAYEISGPTIARSTRSKSSLNLLDIKISYFLFKIG